MPVVACLISACLLNVVIMSRKFLLLVTLEKVKDQTYFLSHLSQPQLRRLLFPPRCIAKDEVRSLAVQMDLLNQARKDSQGICFLGKEKWRGILFEAETRDYLGTHRGFWFYTICQRQGMLWRRMSK